MKGKWIRQISRAAGAAIEHARDPPTTGLFYLSNGRNNSGISYDAEISAGLHIGCGFAPSMESQAPFGALTLAKSGLSFVSSREPIRMCTKLAPSEFRSTGLSIDWQTLADHQLLSCLTTMPENACIGIEAVPPRIVMALVTPIDEWFQGTARDLAVEGRSLALLAVLEQCLVEGSEKHEASGNEPFAVTARDIIEAEYAAPLTIANISVRLKCSPRTLTSAFRRAFDTTIGAYLTRY